MAAFYDRYLFSMVQSVKVKSVKLVCSLKQANYFKRLGEGLGLPSMGPGLSVQRGFQIKNKQSSQDLFVSDLARTLGWFDMFPS
jgi:hypothetical protein